MVSARIAHVRREQSGTVAITPVLESLRQAYGVTVPVVVVDSGMMSANNLIAIENDGFKLVVCRRLTKVPYDLQKHFDAKGNRFRNGQILECTRGMETAKNLRERRIIYGQLSVSQKAT